MKLYVWSMESVWLTLLSMNVATVHIVICFAISVNPLRLNLKVRKFQMKTNNSFDNVNDFVTPEGDRFEPIFSPKVLPDGSIELVESGTKDIQQEIDSWYEHTDMAWILREMAAGTYPERSGAMYGDFTEAPTSMADAMQIMINAENAFYQLDLKTRNKFDNDFKKWMMMAQSDIKQFADLMGFSPDDIEKAPDQAPEGDEK